MMRLHRLFALLRAARRVSPRMGLFMLRRMLRNLLVPRIPKAYRDRITERQRHLPLLASGATAPGPGLVALAAFYNAEYREMVPGLAGGTVSLNGQSVAFGGPERIDWAHSIPAEGDHQMWRVKLAHMGFLCPLLSEGDPCAHRLATTLARYARAHSDFAAKGAFIGFWFPYAASHRILALGAGLVMAQKRRRLDASSKVELAEFLRLNVAFLLDNIEHELCNNHLERNLAALCLYFSHAQSVPPAIAKKLEQWVMHLVTQTIAVDGVQVERSPMYQGLSMAALAVMAETPFLSLPLQTLLRSRAQAVREAFALLCHSDGEVALFNDAWHGEVPVWTGPSAPDGRSILPQGGYGRLSKGKDVCLMDAGPLGPAWNPGHGHADFLSVEVSLGGERLIVDPGTSRYNTGPERARERSAAAHNGPIWVGHEPVEFFGAFKVANLAQASFFNSSLLDLHTLAGKFSSAPGTVARAVRYWPGLGWLVADYWVGIGRGQVRWLIPTSWDISAEDGGFVLRHASLGQLARLCVLLGAKADRPYSAVYASRYGRLDPANSIDLSPSPLVDLLHNAAQNSHGLLTWIGHGPAPQDALQKGHGLLQLLQSQVRK